jgi:hypothetical protein
MIVYCLWWVSKDGIACLFCGGYGSRNKAEAEIPRRKDIETGHIDLMLNLIDPLWSKFTS